MSCLEPIFIERHKQSQECALRLCNKQWDLDYDSLLFVCELPLLATRRKYFNLCMMYKIINHHIHFPEHVFVQQVTPLQPASNLLYRQPHSHTNSFLYSFVPNTCSSWNSLPHYISSLKSSLIDWLFHEMNGDVEMSC